MASFLSLFFAFAILASQLASSRLINEENFMVERHEKWMSHHGRVYKDEEEKAARFKIFKDNVNRINEFNSVMERGYKLSVNQFADLTNKEFQASHHGYERQPNKSEPTFFRYADVTDMPPKMDWREEGAVTPVKNQANCGCCWAFSAVGAMEGINQIKTGELVSLSEQELLDCNVQNQNGCNGGWMVNAFDFIKQNGGLTTSANYPYVEEQGNCDPNKLSTPTAQITGHENVQANNEMALLQAVANQPVSVAIEGTGYYFQHYSSGVFSGPCGTNLDHAVTAVGYGTTDDGTKYWLVKNSWGSEWGENGYMRIQRDVDAEEGLCGIARDASYPIM